MGPLLTAPAEVEASPGIGSLEVYLFPGILAHIGNVHVAGGAVEAEPPRVAQSECPYFVPATACPDEGVVSWNGIGPGARLNVNPQHLAQEGVRVLSVVLGITARAAVSHTYVQVAVIGTEG